MSKIVRGAAFALVLVLGMVLGGAVLAQGAKEEPKKEEPKKEEGKKLDLPWTLEECKKGSHWKKGLITKYKSWSKTGDKEDVSYMVSEITEITEKGWKSKNTTLDKDGKATGEPTEIETTWEDYLKGLDFKDTDTKITEDKYKAGEKEYDCKVYTQTKSEEGGKSKATVYFAKDKAGLIVKYSGEYEYGEMKSSFSYELVEFKE